MNNKVVIGTWPLSGDFGNVGLGQISDTLETCWDLGFREFDTAPNYGNGFIEFCLGRFLFGRQDFMINTKCGNLPFNGKSFAIESLTQSIEQSLKRTGASCINVLFLHNPRTEIVDYEPILRWMETLKAGGKILKTGISLAKGFNYNLELLSHFDFIQDDINLLYLDPLFKELPLQTKLMARSPLASGLLSGAFTSSTVLSAEDHRKSWVKGERLSSILKRVDAIKAEIELPISQLARRYLFSQMKVHKIIFGVKRKEHVLELATDIQKPVLNEELIKKIERLYQSDFGLVDEKHLSY
ncbi:MAG TPA: hypothetical protein DCP55_08605 [Chitinophagaceae bacterium]|nr:aldo/keto reductase [bacterium]HAL95962.1 hypothetical protein [Chitinophagaceae bacterium]